MNAYAYAYELFHINFTKLTKILTCKDMFETTLIKFENGFPIA